MPLDVIETDDALQQFSTSLLRIPTHAITTIPRGGDDATPTDVVKPSRAKPALSKTPTSTAAAPAVDYGGNWILGTHKGVYLRATNDSFVANDETEDEVTETETFTFPFANVARLEHEQDERKSDDDDNEDDDQAPSERGSDNGADEERTTADDPHGAHSSSSSESDDDDEDDGARLQRERAATDRINDELAWRFFAGSIDRARTEQILAYVELVSYAMCGLSLELTITRCLVQ